MIRPHPKVIRVVLLVAVPFVLALIGGAFWLRGGRTVGTEDAYVKADNTTIAPKVSGYLSAVLVGDNEQVKAGQILARIDDRDYRVALDQAKAEMAAKLKALQDQTKGVDERAKARIERRIADLKANFNLRSSKLSQASALTNER